MKKANKIIACVSGDTQSRRSMLCRLAVYHGFARTQGDAAKIIRATPFDFDLGLCYFVLAENYNLRESPATTQRLYELAARGLFVAIGTKRVPPELELICDIYNPNDF
jgi:hypothetical protein